MRGLMGDIKWPASVAQRADARLCVQEAWVRTPTGAVLKKIEFCQLTFPVMQTRVRIPAGLDGLAGPGFESRSRHLGGMTRHACRLCSDQSKLACVLGLYTLAA